MDNNEDKVSLGMAEPVVLAGLLQVAVTAQSSVYVKFLSPPHGYSHKLHLDTWGGIAVSKEDRIYPGNLRYFNPAPLQQNRFPEAVQYQQEQGPPPYNRNRYQPNFGSEQPLQLQPPPPQQPDTTYYYPRPVKPFDSGQKLEQIQPFQTSQTPSGYSFPRPLSGHESEVSYDPTLISGQQAAQYVSYLFSQEVSYDPTLISGPQAAQYVSYLFSQGELFFHLIPHKKLVLMNQQERIENNLVPHILASIRPGHPFFLHR